MGYTDLARASSARGELVLREREDETGRVLELRANGVFVMDTAETRTETELAARALAEVPRPRDVVIAGLGLGFTLQRVLADPRVGRATVVELEPVLVDWMRDGTVPGGAPLLADPRVDVVVDDVRAAFERDAGGHDLILLDVDNGPGYLVHQENDAIYAPDFLRRCRDLLATDGVLAIWSADVSPTLHAAMRTTFGAAEELRYRVDLQGRDEEYVLYTARR